MILLYKSDMSSPEGVESLTDPPSVFYVGGRVDAFTLRYEGPKLWQVFYHHTYGKPDLILPMELQ